MTVQPVVNPMKLAKLLNDLLEFDAALIANTIGYIDHTPAEDRLSGLLS